MKKLLNRGLEVAFGVGMLCVVVSAMYVMAFRAKEEILY